MKNALMVAEKPSLAASLASILSNGRSTSRKSKHLLMISCYILLINDLGGWNI
jgi:hypothetical protein